MEQGQLVALEDGKPVKLYSGPVGKGAQRGARFRERVARQGGEGGAARGK